MCRLFIIISIFLFALKLKGQTDSLKKLSRSKPLDFSYENKWKYFSLKKTIIVTVIYHLPADGACGVYAYSSETIAKTFKGDTIRILDLCNENNYKKDQIIQVEPSTPYKCGDTKKICWITPLNLVKNPKTGNLEQTPNSYDLTIFKTTYGKIIE